MLAKPDGRWIVVCVWLVGPPTFFSLFTEFVDVGLVLGELRLELDYFVNLGIVFQLISFGVEVFVVEGVFFRLSEVSQLSERELSVNSCDEDAKFKGYKDNQGDRYHWENEENLGGTKEREDGVEEIKEGVVYASLRYFS